MMKIIVTGGAGFVGSQLGFRLSQEGHDVTLIDNMSFGYLDNLVVNATTVPEPGTSLMLSIGLLALVLGRCLPRRRSAR